MHSKAVTIRAEVYTPVSQEGLVYRDQTEKFLEIEGRYFNQVLDNVELRQKLAVIWSENQHLKKQLAMMEKNFSLMENMLQSLQGQLKGFKKSLFKWFSLESRQNETAEEKAVREILKQLMMDEIDSE